MLKLMNNYSHKLTIVLTLKGREEFSYRWMEYMNEKKCPYEIVIADGGSDSNLELRLRNTSSYPNIRYKYIRYPYDENFDIFIKKLENVISLIDTTYILLADNDDFYILEKIPELIEFLELNSDYVGARGKLVDFEVFDKCGDSKAKVRGNKYKAYSIDSPSIEDECSLNRISKVCQGMDKYNYYMNWYSILRTKTLQEIWKNLLSLPAKEVIVLEILVHVLLMNSGKLKIMPIPFYLRQANTSEFGGTLVLGNKFLEDCIIKNSFSDFPLAINSFMNLENIFDRNRVLKCIAGWLNQFIYNINRDNQIRISKLYDLNNLIKKFLIIDLLFGRIGEFFKDFILKRTKRTRLKVKDIEPFIVIK